MNFTKFDLVVICLSSCFYVFFNVLETELGALCSIKEPHATPTGLRISIHLCFEIESFHATEADFKIAVALLPEF